MGTELAGNAAGGATTAPTLSVTTVALDSRAGDFDTRGAKAVADLHAMGRGHIERVACTKLYTFKGRLTRATVERLAIELLVDSVVETFGVYEGMSSPVEREPAIEVCYLPGVMDPVAGSTLRAARRLLKAWGVADSDSIADVRTAYRYALAGVRDLTELEWVARRVLSNDCIERAYLDGFGRHDARPDDFPEPPNRSFERRTIRLSGLSDAELAAMSRSGHLFLSVAELKAIQRHFDGLGRDPTDLELETFAQTWSEHCVHKTLKSDVIYRGEDFGKSGTVEVRFENLLKSTIVAATRELNRDWCLSVFEDNAGVIALDDEFGVAFKVETHNHPSAIEPYGGAATGVGGCIRDVLGCGLGAKPIADTDVFCLARPDWPADRVPEGVLHPRRVLNGVVSGVRDYGNRMGIPTVNGAIHFDDRYLANPLVFCGCVGLIPRDRITKGPKVGDRIVLIGGRTGRDGIHGATFSSSELTDTHAGEFSHAVQIGNAIEEKKVLDAVLAARDDKAGCLFHSITDCGAGGLSSAVGEMAAELGADVELSEVPLKYSGLTYDEIWISEAQERMVVAVPPDRLARFMGVCEREEVEATAIGVFTGDGRLRVRYRGTEVGVFDTAFLHGGIPRETRQARWERPSSISKDGLGAAAVSTDLGERLLGKLGEWNAASKEWVIRQYDHEVQAGSVIKPLVGPGEGPSDAAVVRPRLGNRRGIAIGCGLCPEMSDGDPYWMAISAVDEALRNVICVGGDPDRTAILDNFCWGDVASDASLGALVRACRGAYDAAVTYGLPFISGKDSLNNQFRMSASEAQRCGLPQAISIPHTLLISAISVIDDVEQCVSMDAKNPGNRLVLVGPTRDENLGELAAIHRLVAGWIRDGSVCSAHDVSDGGAAAAIAEMCIAGDLGAAISLDGVFGERGDIEGLFSEGRGQYVVECSAGACLESEFARDLGEFCADRVMTVWKDGDRLLELAVTRLREAWRGPLSRREVVASVGR